MRFTGEVHPFADEYPLLGDEEMAALAADIGENGLRVALTLDAQGRLIDGRNRLAACDLAGVEPTFVSMAVFSDEEVAAFISSANDHRRDQKHGVRWMRIGLALQRQGKRSGGRWERSSTKKFVDSASDAKAIEKVGLILDVADRAQALGDDYRTWADLPHRVMYDGLALSAAHVEAQRFDTHAAMAELIAYQPLAEWIGHHTELAREATERYSEPPDVGQAWKPEHIKGIEAAARNYQQAATGLRNLIKERK